jgi:hypothetical protein
MERKPIKVLSEGTSHLSFLSSVFFKPNTWWAPNCWGCDSAKQERERERERNRAPKVNMRDEGTKYVSK